jgi:hypothetical protein
MKSACFLWMLGMLALTSLASAVTPPPTEIRPDWLDPGMVKFEIRSEPLENGDTEFIVKVFERTKKIPDSYFIGLGKVRTTFNSMTSGPTRRTPSVRQEKYILSVFTVTMKELADPDLAFYFSMPAAVQPGFGYSHRFYARLKNFVKP